MSQSGTDWHLALLLLHSRLLRLSGESDSAEKVLAVVNWSVLTSAMNDMTFSYPHQSDLLPSAVTQGQLRCCCYDLCRGCLLRDTKLQYTASDLRIDICVVTSSRDK